MKFYVTFLAVTIAVSMTVSSASAQEGDGDPGLRDTCKLVPEQSTWFLTEDDSILVISTNHFTDDSLGGLQVGFRLRTSGNSDWSPAVDTLVRIDTVIVDAQIGDLRGVTTKRLPSDSMNAFQYGAASFESALLPSGRMSHVADVMIMFKDQNRLPPEFQLHFDSVLVPPTGAFKHVPADPNIGTSYPPYYSLQPLVVTIVKVSSSECGDVNGDSNKDIDDIIYLIGYVYLAGPPPIPTSSGEVNCDAKVDLLDVVYLINYLFRSGPAPCSNCS
jgi:hypothetical protein